MQLTTVTSLYIVCMLQNVILAAGSDEEELSTYGNKFHFGFLRQFLEGGEINIIVHSYHDEPVSFTVSSLGAYNHFGTTTRENPLTLSIPSSFQVRESGFNYRHLGLYIETPDSKEISVTALGYTNNQSPRMTYLVHPYILQFTSQYVYYAVSAKDSLDNRFSQVLIVGTDDNTTVSLRPTQTVSFPENLQETSSFINISSGSTHTFVVHRLQTILITSDHEDLTGTKIVSDRPLSVISGHDCAKVPFTTQTSDCDPLATQAPPTVTWGKEFLLPPLNGRTNGQKYKIITSENNTNVTLNCGSGNVIEAFLNNDGDVYDVDTASTDYCSLLTTKPCYVAEYGFIRDYLSDTIGDPLLITVPPIAQYIHNVTFSAFTAVQKNFFTLLLPYSENPSFSFIYNGNTFGPNWISISYSNGSIAGYTYTATFSGTITISQINADDRMGVIVYGYTTVGGYGYVGGMLLESINSDIDPANIAFVQEVYYVNENAGNLTIALNRSLNMDYPASVRVMTNPDTLNTNKGYVPIEQIVSFAVGETVKQFTLFLLNNVLVDGTETVILTVEPVTKNTVVTSPTDITVIIQDDDVLEIGFIDSPVFTRSVNDNTVEFCVSIISGRLQSGLIVSIELKVGSESQDDSLETLYIMEFSETAVSHSLQTTLNSTVQWTLANLSLTSTSLDNNISVAVHPQQALLINKTTTLSTTMPVTSHTIVSTATAVSVTSLVTSNTQTCSCISPITTREVVVASMNCTSGLQNIISTTSITTSKVSNILVSSTSSAVREVVVSSSNCSESSRNAMCVDIEPISISVIAVLAILVIISCGLNLLFCCLHMRHLKKRPVDSNANRLHDLPMYTNSLYGEVFLQPSKQQLETDLNVQLKPLPAVPSDYDYAEVYEKMN